MGGEDPFPLFFPNFFLMFSFPSLALNFCLVFLFLKAEKFFFFSGLPFKIFFFPFRDFFFFALFNLVFRF